MAMDISSLGQISLGKQGQQAIKNASGSFNQTGTALPSFSGSSTNLKIAGNTGFQQPSPNLPKVTLSQQGNVVAPNINPVTGSISSQPSIPQGYSGPPAKVLWSDDTSSGPGGVRKGDYDPRTLSQDQRQWLWEKFGRSGTAPAGYGGERPPAPPAPPPPPAPVMPPQTQIKPVGSTAPATAITGTGAVGQGAFGATTQAGLAGKSLQLPGLDLGSPTAAPSADTTQETKDWFNQLPLAERLARQLALPTLAATGLGAGALGAGILPILAGAARFAPGVSGLGGLLNRAAPTVSKAQSVLPEVESVAQKGLPPGKIAGLGLGTAGLGTGLANASGAGAGFNPRAVGTPKAITNEQITPEGRLQMTPAQRPMASQQQLQGTIPVEQHGQVLQMYNTGQISKEDAVSAIASPEAKQSIGKMINTAVKAGDFQAASRLADLAPAIDEQLALINQIGQMVLATSRGFGTPNAPGVTEARMPMVQQGVGQALTTPRLDFSSSPVSMPSASLTQPGVPQYRPRFDEVQQNRPPIFPYFNGR